MTETIERALGEIKFGPDGLVPAIAQQHDTGEVLMMAWMDREAVRLTLAEGRACYWSRSRQALWRKGEASGQIQHLAGMSSSGTIVAINMDKDCPLMQIANISVQGDYGELLPLIVAEVKRRRGATAVAA